MMLSRYRQSHCLAALVCLTSAVTAALNQLDWQVNGSFETIFGSNGTLTIKGSLDPPGIIVLDYGANVEGHPNFKVLSAAGDASLFSKSPTANPQPSWITSIRAKAPSLQPQRWTPTAWINTMSPAQ
jgi:hypothetical protein